MCIDNRDDRLSSLDSPPERNDGAARKAAAWDAFFRNLRRFMTMVGLRNICPPGYNLPFREFDSLRTSL